MEIVAAGVVSNYSTVAVQIVGKCAPTIIKLIFTGAKEIREAVRRMKIIKKQSERLSERIDILARILQDKQLDDTLSEPLIYALTNFGTFLQTSLDFINRLNNTHVIKLVWNEKEILAQVQDLHTEFSQHALDINLYVVLTDKLSINKNAETTQQLFSIDIQETTDENNNSLNESEMPNKKLLALTYEETTEKQEIQDNVFDSGVWLYRHGSNDVWQEQSYINLVFASKTNTLSGFGENNLGYFKVQGTFTKRIRAIDMLFSYSNSEFDTNYEQKIRLIFDNNQKMFCGTFNPTPMDNQKSNESVDSAEQFEMCLFDSW